ncbi:hypothetical protein [Cellulosimicrobium sp. SJTW-1]|uniref:hypothetical protein n=1 Tax=Cellulosimicrobium sp. SJTW-1 TaxID=3078082 RepID=UPI0039E7829A
MAHERLKPGEHGEIFVKETASGEFKARPRVRPLDGEMTEVSRTRKSNTAARLAVQNEIDELLKRPKGSVELRPDSKVGLAARQWIEQLRVEATWPRPRRRPQTIDEYERLLGTLMIRSWESCGSTN